jgi:hypothetical protein
MNDLIGDLFEDPDSRAWSDKRYGPYLGKLSDLGFERLQELDEEYGGISMKIGKTMLPGDQEDWQRLVSIIYDLPGRMLDDPFAAQGTTTI